ncbi:MAG: DUF2845 domain-containing protein [Pseudomonadota bacterium]|nr:DUF2845 domain-containing protein [Pseudomonadota bacterium]HJO34918.1 DUF2845 domain-containing protein [Gammaproteobacteria bacterium]
MSAALALLSALLVGTAAADSLRCGRQLVDRGAEAAQIRAVCGEPDYVREWPRRVLGVGRLGSQAHWYYDGVGGRAPVRLRLRDGELRQVEHLAPIAPAACTSTSLVVGLSEYTLLRRCGPPSTRATSWQFIDSQPLARSLPEAVPRERWRYEFGAGRLPRELTLIDGTVVDVDVADRALP